jgi:2-hydroxy-6-oxonona-2,4-dienedioate hydrolase
MPMTNPKWVEAGGIATRYFEAGQGENLILFHGGSVGAPNLCECAIDWELNFDNLARRFHVYAPDKLGQGHTGLPLCDADYTMSAVVRHAHDFLVALDIRDAHVVGHSRGGFVVCRLTLDYPDRIRSCIIVDSNTLAPGLPPSQFVLANPPTPRLSRASQRWVLERYSLDPSHITDSLLDAVCEAASLPAIRESFEKMEAGGLRRRQFLPELARERADAFARLRDDGLRRPTLVVWGRNDPTAALAQGEALFDLIASRQAQAIMTVINHAGHFCFREQSQQFEAAVSGFIECVDGW